MKLVITDFEDETHGAFFDLNDDDYSFYFIHDKVFEKHLSENNGVRFDGETLKKLSELYLDGSNLVDWTV
ncbi:MAG: Uncharacterised protein [SAR116 cluster bacterium]|nr:MAG: Uncharacterised protein [SAR116 cluster bacterium]